MLTPVDDALAAILAVSKPLAPVELTLGDCHGLVLAQEVVAREAHPPFDNSAVDGYAVLATGQPGQWTVVEEIPAGAVPQKTLQPGEAARIATGAMLPGGADAVVMQEDATREGDRVVLAAARAGENVRPKGEHLAEGVVVMKPGLLIGPAQLSMAAYLGYGTLRCHRRPDVVILTSGDELVEPGRPLSPGQIYNSNAYALEAAVRENGGHPLRLPLVKDDPAALRAVLESVDADLLITSAGVSVGDRDYVLKVLQELGAELTLWRIAMRPGKPLGFGHYKGHPFLALPGNPVSSLVTFEIFGKPLLTRLRGLPDTDVEVVDAILDEPVRKKEELRFFHRCQLHRVDGQWHARLTGNQGSHILHSLVLADGLLDLPQGVDHVDAGSSVKVRLLWNSAQRMR